ncbi:MAG: aspartate kinase [Oscillospiraceae bacterium]|nr:aspartate kinase [Oscillospiraceae bacterium]
METIVVKFGGTSLASAAQIRKAAEIIRSNPARRYVVCSAPGKRDKSDTKVTDLLLQSYAFAAEEGNFAHSLAAVEERFAEIVEELGADFDLPGEIAAISRHLNEECERDYMVSRGEYLNSKLIAAYLGFPFVDPAECVCFQESGELDAEETNRRLFQALSGLDHAVVAGFYGAGPDGKVRTFSRGGSDITGSIVARAVGASLYENWTDVSGMLAADPAIVDNPRVIDYISYQELRELSYMGSSVFHEDAVFPCQRAGIPINIRNTNRPADPGTMIVASLPRILPPRTITGVAGHKGFTSIQVEKAMMNGEIGFGAGLLKIFADHGVSFEHCPTGIDTMSVIAHGDAVAPCKEQIMQDIREKLHPDALIAEEHLALIAVVGHGMSYSKGTAASIFSAVSEAGINIRMIDQGSSELNIIIAVEEKDMENAIRSIYEKLI